MDLFTRREGHPRKRVNPSWRAKDSPGLQANFPHRGRVTLQPEQRNTRMETIKMISAQHSSNMAKNKLPKKSHSMVIFLIKVRRFYRDFSSQLTPREIIELEVKNI